MFKPNQLDNTAIASLALNQADFQPHAVGFMEPSIDRIEFLTISNV